MSSANDEMFLEILKKEKNVTNFLDAFFGFLFRRTDFYIESKPEQKLGFPPGIAESLVRNTFKKWQSQMISNSVHKEQVLNSIVDETNVPPAIQELEITEEKPVKDESKLTTFQPSECYNGAIRDKYTWSQTISDLDVLINVPSCVVTAKHLKVDITASDISISVNTKCLLDSKNEDIENFIAKDMIDSSLNWTNIFKGKFSFKTRKEESLWSFIPAQHVSVHLEKYAEKWWESLLIDEPKIKLNDIDCSRDISELDDSEQMKVQELMWNHQQKILGKPTSEQTKMEQILKQAWNAEGSPFKGQPYDPSVLQYD